MKLLKGERWIFADALFDLVHCHGLFDDIVVVKERLRCCEQRKRLILSHPTFLSTGFKKYWFRSSPIFDFWALVSL